METTSDFYGNGGTLPRLHPDDAVNNEILIGALCANLDTARQALSCAMEMNVVTPAAVAMKRQVRWALDETHPRLLSEQHNDIGERSAKTGNGNIPAGAPHPWFY